MWRRVHHVAPGGLVDTRTVATSVAFAASLMAGAGFGWWQGPSTPNATASARSTNSAPWATALESAGGASAAASTSPLEEAPVPADSTYPAYDGEVFAVGDSVLAGAAACLAARGIDVDAEQSRQVTAALDLLSKKASKLPPRVIVHIGTNGGASPAQLDAIMGVLGSDRLVLWSTIQLPDDPSRYTYERSTNDAIAGLADRYDNVRIFDWESVSLQQPAWLYLEGIHMTPEGCEGYAGLVEPQVRAPGPYGNP